MGGPEPNAEGQFKEGKQGFLSGSLIKNPPANIGDTDSVSSLGRSHMPWGN